jgi:rhodanese-related sulfurtransferase
MNFPKSRRVFTNIIILIAGLGLLSYLIKHAWTSWHTSATSNPATASSPDRRRPHNAELPKDEPKILKADEVKKIIDRRQEQVVILDIQDRGKFKEEHLPSAINIPSDELEVRAEDELSKSDLIIIVDCACDGTNTVSLIRRSALVNLGFKDVAILDEGLNAWRRSSFGVITEKQ